MKLNDVHLSHPKYRPDIDGLRAISVLAVVFFHAFPGKLVGGFIGVDCFFVISGYLISTIIFENLAKGTFCFLGFYMRRILRIFPSLFLTLAACFIFADLSLIAQEKAELGKHMAAGAGFVSNIILWNEAGYFDSTADTKPLLHLWSLAIEEQFYILYPVLLLLIFKKFNPFAVIVIFCIISFALNVLGINQDNVATFYSPQTRFWQLLCGGCLAYISINKMDFFLRLDKISDKSFFTILIKKMVQQHLNLLLNISSLIGIFLLTYGFLRIDKGFNFPGYWALLPVIATLLIISSGPNSYFNRILSNRFLVWFGLISFPLYLFHWPILSFARIMLGYTPPPIIRISLILLSIVLAWLTYKFVESPARNNKNRIIKSLVLMILCASMGFAGLAMHKDNSSKNNIGYYGHDAFFEYLDQHFVRCTNNRIFTTSLKYKKYVRCYQTKPGEPDFILLGDSHAEHLFIGLADTLKTKNIAFYISSGQVTPTDSKFQIILDELLSSQESKHILLVKHYVSNYTNQPSKLYDDFQGLIKPLISRGHKLAIVGDVLRFEPQPQDCVMEFEKPTLRKDNGLSMCKINLSDAKKQEQIYNTILQNLSGEYQIPYFPITHLMCNDNNCSMTKDGILYYRDNNHLNIEGSYFVGRKLGDMLILNGFNDR
jgi:peptidoglycan/LPS O-acetylase OafA/YrhL